jgi:pantoate--beta-alanine ligase
MTASVPVIRRLDALREQVAAWHQAGEAVGLVPTMGALHEGHLSLVRLARERCRRVVVSIFVNPAQFAPNEDFARYPRDEAGDLAKLASVDCDLVWSPEPAEMYPEGFATRIAPAGAAAGLESDFRPHFFAGVATVCCKLFMQVRADIAVFGEKVLSAALCRSPDGAGSRPSAGDRGGADRAGGQRTGDELTQRLPHA